MMTPWNPNGRDDCSMAEIEKPLAVQFDLLRVLQIETQTFKSEQCDVFGAHT